MIKNSYGNTNWTFPGGGIKRGENSKIAALRELKEETGIDARDAVLIGKCESSLEYKKDHIDVYLIELDTKTNVDNKCNEIKEIKWFELNQIPELYTTGKKVLALLIDYYAKIIWDYMLVHQQLEKADAIFALGSNDTKVADRSADLYLQGYASKIIFSGGFGKAAHFAEPEAKVFASIAIEKGVSAEDIILEDKATNTGENVLFTQKLLREKELDFKSFILVQKPYMERRTFATFSKLWPGVQFSVTSPEVSFEEYSENRNWVHVMVGDLQRIKEYPAKGFQIPHEIPDEVWNAYEKLVELGFTKYLIKD